MERKNYQVSEETADLMELLNEADELQERVCTLAKETVLVPDELISEFLARWGKARETIVKIVQESIFDELNKLKPTQL